MSGKNETQAPVEATTEQAPVELTLNDIIAMHNIINVVVSRGAIKPEEMSVVGGVYDKVTAFLKANATTEPAPEEATESESEEAAEKTEE